MTSQATRDFIDAKIQALVARARRLSVLTPKRVGIRPEDVRFAPSAAHFKAANQRLRKIDSNIAKRMRFLQAQRQTASPKRLLVYMALLEREVDRSRRTFGMLFEVFSQRGSAFAPALAAHDAIAADCYLATKRSAPLVFDKPLLKPLTYMEHGYSPATMRRGVSLARLLGENNPFPLIRIPWDRDNPWQSVFLHEVAHNLQADLGLWRENQQALTRRLILGRQHPMIASTYRRWHKEIFADLAALLLGGTASAWGMMDFLAHPGPRTLTFKPGGAHPTGLIRVMILAEMLKRMGFEKDATAARRVWKNLYDLKTGHRIPKILLSSADRVIPEVVDEIAFQTRRNLAQRALVDVIRFTREDEAAIRRGAILLARGRVPDLPPRFLVSASRFALTMGAPADRISKLVINHLSRRAAEIQSRPVLPLLAAA